MRCRCNLGLVGLSLALALIVASPLLAAPGSREGDPASILAVPNAAEGWIEVAEGAWQRIGEDGGVETTAKGKAGLTWVLQDLRTELTYLVSEFLINPDEETKEILDTQLQMIAEVERNIANWRPQVAPEKAVPYCLLVWDATAGPTSCGNQAAANASYNGTSESDCFGSCTVYSYAYVRRTCSSTTNTASQSCSKSGINQSCSSSASLGSCYSSCYSYGYSSISCPNLFKSKSASSSQCSTGLCCLCKVPICKQAPASRPSPGDGVGGFQPAKIAADCDNFASSP